MAAASCPRPARTVRAIHAGHMDLVVLATKAWQFDSAMEQMKPSVGDDSPSPANDMEHMDGLLSNLDHEHVLGWFMPHQCLCG